MGTVLGPDTRALPVRIPLGPPHFYIPLLAPQQPRKLWQRRQRRLGDLHTTIELLLGSLANHYTESNTDLQAQDRLNQLHFIIEKFVKEAIYAHVRSELGFPLLCRSATEQLSVSQWLLQA